MNAFGFVRFQTSISSDSNFQTFQLAFMTLLRISTGEGWGGLMSDFSRQQLPNFVCVDIINYEDYKKFGNNGCGTGWSYLFFFSYELIFKMIVLNLFIAVILQSFEDYTHRANFIVNDDGLFKAQDMWKLYDSNAIGLISMKDYEKFINILPNPLGIQRDCGESLMKYSNSLGIPVYRYKSSKKKEFFFFYYDFFLAASKKAVLTLYDNEDILEPFNHVKLLEKFWRNKMRNLMKIRNLVVTEFDVSDYLASMKITNFLNNCTNQYYKNKRLNFMKAKLKSLSFIDLPSLLLKKNSSSKKSKISYESQEESKIEKDEIIEKEDRQEIKIQHLVLKGQGPISTIFEEKEIDNEDLTEKKMSGVQRADLILCDISNKSSFKMLNSPVLS